MIKILSLVFCVLFLLTQISYAFPYEMLRPGPTANSERIQDLAQGLSPENAAIVEESKTLDRYIRFIKHEFDNYLNHISGFLDELKAHTAEKDFIETQKRFKKVCEISKELCGSLNSGKALSGDMQGLAENNKKLKNSLLRLRDDIKVVSDKLESVKSLAQCEIIDMLSSSCRSSYQILEDLICLLEKKPIENTESVDLKSLLNLLTGINIDVEPGFEVIAKKGTLRIIIRNLQDNASDAAREQELEYRFDLRAYRDGKDGVMEFTNNGQLKNLDNFAKPGYTTKTDKPERHGYGTCIVKTLTEAYGGSIKAENLADNKARITIRLPLAQGPSVKKDEAKDPDLEKVNALLDVIKDRKNSYQILSRNFSALSKIYDSNDKLRRTILENLVDIVSKNFSPDETDISQFYSSIVEYILGEYETCFDFSPKDLLRSDKEIKRKLVYSLLLAESPTDEIVKDVLDTFKEAANSHKDLRSKTPDNEVEMERVEQLLAKLLHSLTGNMFKTHMRNCRMEKDFQDTVSGYFTYLLYIKDLEILKLIYASDNSYILRVRTKEGKECILKFASSKISNKRIEKEFRIIKKLNPENKRNDFPKYDKSNPDLIILANGRTGFMLEPFPAGYNFYDYVYSKKANIRDNVSMLLKIARALVYMHSKGIVHRDLKPDNIFVTKNGDTLIYDFGLSEKAGDPRPDGELLFGTLPYMAPESMFGKSEYEDQNGGISFILQDRINVKEDFGFVSDTKEDVFNFGLLIMMTFSEHLLDVLCDKADEGSQVFQVSHEFKEMIRKEFSLKPKIRELVLSCLEIKPRNRCGILDAIAELSTVFPNELGPAAPSVAEAEQTKSEIHDSIVKVYETIHKNPVSEILRVRTKEGRDCVLKICMDDDKKDKFEKEFEMIKMLNPQNKRDDLPKYLKEYPYMLELSNGKKAFLMEQFPPGDDLIGVLFTKHSTVDERLQIFLKAAKALKYIHDKGIVHSDFKPDSLWVTDSMDVILYDFNISNREGFEYKSAVVVGTVPYIAPEKYMGFDVAANRKEDVFSFGVSLAEAFSYVLYVEEEARRKDYDGYMFTGSPEYRQMMNRELEYLPDLRDLVARCVETDPEIRCTDQELIDRLDSIISNRQKKKTELKKVTVPAVYKELKNILGKYKIYGSGSNKDRKKALGELKDAAMKNPALVWALLNGITRLSDEETKRYRVIDFSKINNDDLKKSIEDMKIGDIEIKTWDRGGGEWTTSKILAELGLDAEKTRFILPLNSDIKVDSAEVDYYNPSTLEKLVNKIASTFETISILISVEFDKLKELTRNLTFV